MLIKDMFAKQINRPIDGVINVERKEDEAVLREIEEYVITRELKTHFMSFFNYYAEGFDAPKTDIGVWISGFFGSGKSHFLKMLSYLLSNKEVNGTKPVELFREKFDDDPGTFMLIDKSTRCPAETILFDIDNVGMAKKDNTVVLRIFAKMFYKKIGFYGDNLKLAMLEQHINEQGLTEEFKRMFSEINGEQWENVRPKIGFFEDDVIETLQKVLGMSEAAARHWFDSTSEDDELSIDKLTDEMAAYVEKKPKDYRLLFMIDEVGQYIGTDHSMLLNLQTLIEQIGAKCKGKVWVMCTGQEALDEIIKVRVDEFSRILGRFKVRLSLTSSSADEVIQRRILAKDKESHALLAANYEKDAPVLKNLFQFKGQVQDIKGFSGPDNFADNYPFAPYQYTVLQGVFNEVRKSGFAGKHMSGGERSMLSAFQEATIAIMDKDERAIVPFWRFYDTLQTFLDSNIRMIIDRCDKAARNHDGIEPQDVQVLKLLYLMKNMKDIPSNQENITILMTDSIDVDRINQRRGVIASLERLMSQNYVSRADENYCFLTDEEQEIQRGINQTSVPDSTTTKRIAEIIYGDIFTAKKFRSGSGEFPFDQYVDGQATGSTGNDMTLKFLTLSTDESEKNDMHLRVESQVGQAIVVLANTGYYQKIEQAQQIKLYTKNKNVRQMSVATQKIIEAQHDQADKYEEDAKKKLEDAIQKADFFVAGEKLNITSGDAKSRIEQALSYLVSHVYSDFELITDHAKSDADIVAILTSGADGGQVSLLQSNTGAATKMEEFLDIRARQHFQTTMADIQDRYHKKPYGWSDTDIACVMARLVHEQKVTIKYGGNIIPVTDSRLPSMLRQKSEIGKTQVSKRVSPSALAIKKAVEFLRDYLDCMDVPKDEDSLVAFIIKELGKKKNDFEELNKKYDDRKYPERNLLIQAIALLNDVLSQKKDNVALIERLNSKSDELSDNMEDMASLTAFFQNQVSLFDEATSFLSDMDVDSFHINKDADASAALGQIRLITTVKDDRPFQYDRIPELNGLMYKVRSVHNAALTEKKKELLEVVRHCMKSIHTLAIGIPDARDIIEKADIFYTKQKDEINASTGITMLEGKIFSLTEYQDNTCTRIEVMKAPKSAPKVGGERPAPASKKNIKTVLRLTVFPQKRIESNADVDAYVESLRRYLKMQLQDCDGLQIK